MLNKIYRFAHELFSSPKERKEYSGGYWQQRVRENALFLSRKANGRALEVGCGEGLFLIRLAKERNDLELYGVDNDSSRLDLAKDRAGKNNLRNINFLLQDATGLSFKDEFFDLIVCINVIFNLNSVDAVKKALTEMARVCKKGGRLVFDFRNNSNPLLYLKYKLAPLYDPTVKDLPLKTYKFKALKDILDGLGFEVVNRVYIGFPLKSIAPLIIIEAEKR